jgi:4-amino-4-deoxy-L-arabinose transferase-like glycosyltransferase
LLALALRLVALVNMPEEFVIPPADSAEYDNFATDLLAGKGFIDHNTGMPTSRRVPLYPLFLASIYFIFGHNYFAVRFIQCFMSALLCVIIFYIGKTIFGRKVGLLSATILALYQPSIFSSYFGGPTFLLSENLSTFLLALLMLFLSREFKAQSSARNYFIPAVLMGLLLLTRPIFGPFMLFLFGLLVFKNKGSFLLRVERIVFLIVPFSLVVSPWVIRNYAVHKAFVPFSTAAGAVLLSGNNPLVRGSGIADVDVLLTPQEKDQVAQMSEPARDKFYRQRAREFLLKNYEKIPKLYLKKLLVGWDLYINRYNLDGSVDRKYNLWYAIVLMFHLLGMAKAIRSRPDANILLFASLFIYISIIFMVFDGDPRFHYPIDPYLIILASLGIFSVYDFFKHKTYSFATIGSIIFINFLFYLYSDLFLNWVRRLLAAVNL